jgi:hypothetical protein
MKRKTITFFLLLLATCQFVPLGVKAQDEAPKTFKNAWAVQPLYWLNSGFRLDYERQLKDPNHWLQISGIGYYIEDDERLWGLWMLEEDFPVSEAWGAGLEVDYKWYPFKRPRMYVSGGVSFAHFDVDYRENGYQYISYVNDGLTYYEPQWEEREVSQYFNRLGTNLCLGFQTRPARRFLIDYFVGIGYAYSFYDADKRHPSYYYNSLAYRGVTLTTGFRIGFRL